MKLLFAAGAAVLLALHLLARWRRPRAFGADPRPIRPLQSSPRRFTSRYWFTAASVSSRGAASTS